MDDPVGLFLMSDKIGILFIIPVAAVTVRAVDAVTGAVVEAPLTLLVLI